MFSSFALRMEQMVDGAKMFLSKLETAGLIYPTNGWCKKERYGLLENYFKVNLKCCQS